MYNWPGRRMYSHYGECFAHEALTVGSSSVSLTSSIYAPPGEKAASIAVVSVEGGSVRFREDGGDPDANAGHLLYDGDICVIRGLDNIGDAKFFGINGGATVQVSYYR